MCVCARVCVRVEACVCACACVCTHVCVRGCAWLRACVCKCVYARLCVRARVHVRVGLASTTLCAAHTEAVTNKQIVLLCNQLAVLVSAMFIGAREIV